MPRDEEELAALKARFEENQKVEERCRSEVTMLSKLAAASEEKFNSIDGKLDKVIDHLERLNGAVLGKAEIEDLEKMGEKVSGLQTMFAGLNSRVTLILAIGGPALGIIVGILLKHVGLG